MDLPKIAFNAQYEDNIKNVIFNAMDCKLDCNRVFNKEIRWFKDYPEFTLTRSPSFHNKEVLEVSRNHGEYFEMSILRINKLYSLICTLFPEGTFTTQYNQTYDITIHQIFNLGQNVWANVDLQSVFFCEPPIMPEEYNEWITAVTQFDYTYMMSDSHNTFLQGRKEQERIERLKHKLNDKVCTLWYNYVLGRMRTRPQDMSFGIINQKEWNTLEEAYKEFRLIPDFDPYIEPGEAMVNTPCIGFPVHPKKIGWMEGDWNMEYYYSGSRPLTKEEYMANL